MESDEPSQGQRGSRPGARSSPQGAPKSKRARNGPSGSRSTRWCFTFNDRAAGGGERGHGRESGSPGQVRDAGAEAEEDVGSQGAEEGGDGEAGSGGVAGVSLFLPSWASEQILCV